MIARRVVAIQNEGNERKESQEKLEETWDEGTDYLSCRVCIRYKDHYQMPPHLHQMRKINFGIIGKQGKDGKPRTRKELTKSAKKHAGNDLHLWCMQKAEQEKQEVKTFEDTNREVATNIIRAALKNLKRGLGA